MADRSDFLWGMYQEHTTQGRHHESQRASLTNYIIVVAGGLVAFIANRDVTKVKWPIATFLIIIGLFGAFFTAKQYERFRFHMVAAGKYREELERLVGDDVSNLRA